MIPSDTMMTIPYDIIIWSHYDTIWFYYGYYMILSIWYYMIPMILYDSYDTIWFLWYYMILYDSLWLPGDYMSPMIPMILYDSYDTIWFYMTPRILYDS